MTHMRVSGSQVCNSQDGALTPDESRGSVHRSDGIVPAAASVPVRHRLGRAGRIAGLGAALPLVFVTPPQLVISAQTNPASSRATAVMASGLAFPPVTMRRYFPCSRRCAFHDRAMVSGAAPSWRRRRVTPTAGANRQAQAASVSAVRTGPDPALVICPRQVRSPPEYSHGTSPV